MLQTLKEAVVIWVPLISVALAYWVAKRNGVFSRTKIQVGLFDFGRGEGDTEELVIGGSLARANVLVPITFKVSNNGTAAARDIEVGLEAKSDVVVNYPKLYISPSVSSAFVSVEAPALRLANERFRRVYSLPVLNPGKSIQLNNAGLPRNSLPETQSIARSSVTVTIFEPGRRRQTKEYGVWLMDTSDRNFEESISALARDLRREYKAQPLLTRLRMRLNHRSHGAELMFIEITKVRQVSMEGEIEPFFTVENVNTSYGYRFLGGEILHGPSGLH